MILNSEVEEEEVIEEKEVEDSLEKTDHLLEVEINRAEGCITDSDQLRIFNFLTLSLSL